MISEFLFLEEDATKDEKSNYVALKIEIRQLLKDPFNRQVLSEVLLDLRKDISGEAQQSLFKLYQDLGLHKDAFAKLKGWRWQIISKGILELTQMEVAESYSFITKFINDKRSTIRKQAEIATVTLRHEGINYFLDTTKYKISEWQQLKLLDVIRNKEDFHPPRFKAWLTSNNKYVVLFALRLIKYYNQNDADASLIELVKHKNNQIKEEAIACIKEFNVTESLDTLKLVFWNCSINVKIAILDAIAEIGSQTDIDFLNLIDKKELNFSVKSKALSSINAISPESIMPSKGIQDESRYRVPDDITEAVAKMHAEKHAEISGENDDAYTDEEITEEQLSASVKDLPTLEEVPDESDQIETDNVVTLDQDEIAQDISSWNETHIYDTKRESTNLIDINNIEVELDMDAKERFEENEIDDTNWEIDHLDFLPIVVTNKIDEAEDSSCREPMENILVLPVVYEEFLVDEESKNSEVCTPDEEIPSFYDEFNMSELAFLPIVVENNPNEHTEGAVESENEQTTLFNIPVKYHEVRPNSIEENKEAEYLTMELEFDFEAPHAIKDVNAPNSASKTDLNYEEYATEEIRNTVVAYEDVSKIEFDIETNAIEVIEPFFFSDKNESKQTIEVNFNQEDEHDEEIHLPIENEQLLQKIIDDLISFDNKPSIEENMVDDAFANPDWDLDESELDFIPVSFKKEEEQAPKFIKIESAGKEFDHEEINIPRASIPKAIFGDIEFEASTRQLLNDLAEMGDQREIPFLKELLNHEKYEIFKDRIIGLIDTFNHEENKEEIDNPLQPFSVFQDLFRTCDDEAKLILLNEVVEVGDEKEIHFLEDLIEDDSPEIRKKALAVLKELRFKLFGQEETSTNSDVSKNKITSSINQLGPSAFRNLEPDDDFTDIFDLNFDITDSLDEHNDEDEKKKDENQNTVQYGSFFGQMCSFSNKILEKLNG